MEFDPWALIQRAPGNGQMGAREQVGGTMDTSVLFVLIGVSIASSGVLRMVGRKKTIQVVRHLGCTGVQKQSKRGSPVGV